MRSIALLLAELFLLTVIAAATLGQKWDGGDSSKGNWTLPNNWDTNVAPVNDGTANIIFAGSVRPSSSVNVNYNINSLTFDNTATAFTISGSPLTIQGGGITHNDTDTQTFTNAIVLGANQTWDTASGELVMNGIVSGAFTLTKAGNSTLTLAGANTYSGGTTLQAGTVAISNATSFGTGSVSVAGDSTIQATGAIDYGNNLSVGAALSLKNVTTTASTAEFTGVLSGSGNITVVNNGTNNNNATLAFTNTGNTFTGNVLMPAGSVAGNDTFRFASIGDGGNFTLQKAGHRNAVTYTGSTNITFNTRQMALGSTFGNASGGLFDGNEVPINMFRNNGAGTVTFNTNLAGTTIAAGGGTLWFGGSNAGNNTFAGVIAQPTTGGALGIGKYDAGKWVLSNAGNSYTGNVLIADGTLSVNAISTNANNQPLGKGSVQLGYQSTNGILEFTGSSNSATDKQVLIGHSTASHAGGGSILNNGTGSLTFSNATFNPTISGVTAARTLTLGGSYNGGANEIQGVIQNNAAGGAVAVTVSSSTWSLAGANSYTGGTNLNGGILALGSAGALGTTGTISFGGGTVQHSAANTTDYSSRFSTAASQAYSVDTNGQNITWATALTSSGGTLTKSGAGTLTLTGASTYSGGTTLSAGTLTLGASSTPTSGAVTSGPVGTGTLTLSGGTLASSGFFTIGNAISVAASTTTNVIVPVLSGGTNFTLTGPITGSGTFQTNSTTTVGNSLILTGDLSGFTGTFSFVGSLNGNNLSFNGTTPGSWNASAAKFSLSGTTSGATTSILAIGTTSAFQMGELSGTGGLIDLGSVGSTTLQIGALNTSPAAFSGVIGRNSNITVTKVGTGTLTLSGANAYTGGTNLNGGTISLASSGALGTTGTISFGGGTLQHSAGNTTDYSSRFSTAASQAYSVDTNGQVVTWAANLTSSGGTLTKLGSGALTLSGANTYTGGTNINGGTIALDSSGALGTTGTISFGGGTLQHSTVNTTDYSSRFSTAASQAYSVNTGGQSVTWAANLTSSGGSLTKWGPGTLTLSGTSNVSGDTVVYFGTLAIAAGLTNGSGYLGSEPSTTGAATVSGAGAQWTNSANLFLGAQNATTDGGVGTLTVSSGGRLQVGNDTFDSGSSSEMIIGSNVVGNGNLYIRHGSTVTNDGAAYLGASGGYTGSVTVTGSGSQWNNSGQLLVGYDGTGTLIVENGGYVSSGLGHVGFGSTSSATVSGAGSQWYCDGMIVYLGAVTVQAGGVVTSGTFDIAPYGSSSGTVTVTGTGSQWNNASIYFHVGNNGTGTLNVLSGGQVSTLGAQIGRSAGSTGTATVSGTGSQWNIDGRLHVGGDETGADGGVGTLTVSSGGRVQVGNDTFDSGSSPEMIIGSNVVGNGNLYIRHGSTVTNNGGAWIGASGGYTGTATVTGAGSTWTSSTNLFLGAQDATTDGGVGTLSVTSGGRVQVGNDTFDSGSSSEMMIGSNVVGNGNLYIRHGSTVTNDGAAYLGASSGYTGSVTVTGSGSQWNNSGQLTVGRGTLVVENGGSVSSGLGLVGFGSTSSATVSGAGSQWYCDGMIVGLIGSGTVTVQAGGVVTSGTFDIAPYGSSSGTVTVTGAGSQWNNASSFFHVGNNGTGTLNVLSGGQVSTLGGQIGRYAGSTGTATVSGTGSQWNIDGSLHVGGDESGADGGVGTLTVSSGGRVQVGNDTFDSGSSSEMIIGSNVVGNGNLYVQHGSTVTNDGGAWIGASGGYTGTATVNGSGSQWNNSGNLNVGSVGDGTLNVQAAGVVANNHGYIASGFSSTSSATVTGSGSQWNNTGTLTVGHTGNGTLNVQAGGVVTNTYGFIGLNTPATGIATVTGSGSQWTSSTNLYVGALNETTDGGVGTLAVTSGGRVQVGNDTFDSGSSSEMVIGSNVVGNGNLYIRHGSTVTNDGTAYLGASGGYTGAVTVTGSGSQWNNTGNLEVGLSGTGTLIVANGGYVSNTHGRVGYNSNSNNSATVTGSGSQWVCGGTMSVGILGSGTLNVQAGGVVSSNDGAIGFYAGSTGTVNVTGAGSQWNVPTIYFLVGVSGTGTLNVQNGGQVSTAGGQIGIFAGGTGTVTVSGAGSQWTDTGSLYLGGSNTAAGGAGTLTVANSGTVSIGGTLKLWGSGAVNVSGGTITTATTNLTAGSSINASGGTTNLGTLSFAGGTLNVNGGNANISNLTYTSGAINFSAGSVAYGGAGGAVVSSAGLTLIDSASTPSLLLASPNLDASKTLSITNTTTIDPFRTLTLSGGTLNTGSLVVNGTLAFNSGTLGITGAGGLTIGGGGPLGTSLSVGAGRTIQVTNNATVQAGATLAIDDGGTINAGSYTNAGTILLRGATGTVAGGTLTNTGILRGDGNLAAGVLNSAGGEIRGENGKTLTLLAANGTNAGKVNLQGGTVQLSQPLTNGSTGLITGRGTLMTGGTGLTNQGNVALSSGTSDIFGDVVNNTGDAAKGIQISGNANVTFWDDVTQNTGSLFNVSTGSSVTFFGTYGGVGITGGGNKFFEGDITPGFSPGTQDFGGNTYYGVNSNLQIQIAGLTPGFGPNSHDQVNVTGQASLDGTLTLSNYNGFVPVAGDRITAMTFGSRVGTFANVAGTTAGPGLTYVPVYSATNLVVLTTTTGEKAWIADSNGISSTGANWSGGVAPGGVGDTMTFSTIITGNRQVTIDAPTTVGTIKFDDDNNYTISGTSAITLENTGITSAVLTVQSTHGNGAHTISAPLTLASDLSITQNSTGALTISGGISNPANKSLTKNGAGTVALATGLNLNSGNLILNAGQLTINQSGVTSAGLDNAVSRVGTLSIANDGAVLPGTTPYAGSVRTYSATLDLRNNDLIINTATLADVNDMVRAGMGDTTTLPWTGPGITSSYAQNGNPLFGQTGLGVVRNIADPTLATGPALHSNFDGLSTPGNEILVKYTWYGDFDLDGAITSFDFALLDAGFAGTTQHGLNQPGWFFGDANLDGTVNSFDYALTATGYSGYVAAAPNNQLPEPSTLILAALGVAGLFAAKRRRSR